MAEGGGEEDFDNPFSFKNYVKKKTKRPEDSDIDSEDIFALPTNTTRKKEKPILVVAEDDNDDGVASSGAKKKNKGNPFSFKKFLDQKGPKPEDASGSKHSSAPTVSRNGLPTVSSAPTFSPPAPAASRQVPDTNPQSSVPPDFASDLPDFIQNHFSEDQARKQSERHQLPDFTIDSQRPRTSASSTTTLPFRDSLGDGGASLHAGARLRETTSEAFDPQLGSEGGLADSTFSDEEEEGGQRSRQFDGLSLPDFLVDSAVPGAITAQAGDSRDSPGASREPRLPELPVLVDSASASRSVNAPDQAVIAQLREENGQLRALVAQLRQRNKAEDDRVAGLEKELARLQKKEAEETAVMEKAVQQVEENLVATTKRAVKAETQVAKLKQDIKGLQAQIQALKVENETLTSGDKGLADLRERTKYASRQLTTAAVSAESSLRDLMGGVEKLKLLGHILSSFEKVTDAEDPETSGNTTV